MIAAGNLFAALVDAALADAALADAGGAERIETLAAAAGARVERIVSMGQVSPEGFWYDQERIEFVALLAGSARLRVEDEAAPRDLGPGDWLVLPAHCRHRVEATSRAPAAVWLAVYVG